MKKLIFAALLSIGFSAVAQAISPVRYVQISTNTLSKQSGSLSVQGVVTSTVTASSATIVGLNVTTINGAAYSTGGTGGQLPATATNDNAAAGKLGEYVESVVGSTAFPATNVAGDLASISLTAGDWDVTALINTEKQSGAITSMDLAILLVSGNSVSGAVQGSNFFSIPNPTANTDMGFTIPSVRMSLASTTTVYLKYRTNSASAVPNARGARLSARRMR